jgi:hypothetical protein
MKIYRIALPYDKPVDDLVLAGWAVANQLEEGNYARRAWDVAFRIWKAATIKQRDIAIRELKNAGKVLVKELWKTGIISDPEVKKYFDDFEAALLRLDL